MANVHIAYQLDECLDWIFDNKFSRVALQLKHEDLKHSVDIINYLNDKAKERLNQLNDGREPLNLYIAKTNTCCVDLLVTQHVTNLQAIIHFGKVCLSRPELKDQSGELPTLFVFGLPSSADDDKILETSDQIIAQIKSIIQCHNLKRAFVVYDTDMIHLANMLKYADDISGDCLDIAKLRNPSPAWFTTKNNESYFMQHEESDANLFGQYILKQPVDNYDCAIYLGVRNSMHLILNGPSKQFRLIPKDEKVELETINVSKVLNRRMALVGRLKDEEELNVGVILTNPLPNIGDVSAKLESYARLRKHRLYYISMIQTIDECKVGNFDLCDAFVVINSCTCSTILESLVFNRPIIAEHEFKLACGIEAEYGRVLWPGSSSHLTVDDMINKRKVSDVSLALIHTRNELLERCSQARTNKWSGMEYKASSGSDGGDGLGENLEIVEGLHGIASSYASEPLKRNSGLSSSSNNDEQLGKNSSCFGACNSSSTGGSGNSNDDAMLCSSQGIEGGGGCCGGVGCSTDTSTIGIGNDHNNKG